MNKTYTFPLAEQLSPIQSFQSTIKPEDLIVLKGVIAGQKDRTQRLFQQISSMQSKQPRLDELELSISPLKSKVQAKMK
jgi:hypothetical protein